MADNQWLISDDLLREITMDKYEIYGKHFLKVFWLQSYLLHILAFGNILISNLYSRITEVFQQISRVQAHQIRCFISFCNDRKNISNIKPPFGFISSLMPVSFI